MYQYVVGEVGSYFQLVVTSFVFFVSPYQTRQCSISEFILTPLSISLDPPLMVIIIYHVNSSILEKNQT